MTRYRAVAILCFAPLALSTVLGAVSCDTKAVGIDDCRAIEAARCTAARRCDDGIDTDAKEEACQRFAHDNCLHGLATKDEPRASAVSRCIKAIEGAAACAKDDPDGLARDCESIRGTSSPSDDSVCEIIENPEDSSECSFLAEIDYPDAAAATPEEDSGTEAGAN